MCPTTILEDSPGEINVVTVSATAHDGITEGSNMCWVDDRGGGQQYVLGGRSWAVVDKETDDIWRLILVRCAPTETGAMFLQLSLGLS